MIQNALLCLRDKIRRLQPKKGRDREAETEDHAGPVARTVSGKADGQSSCQGRPGPGKVGKEGLEKDTESDVGANASRLDSKAGSYNRIAIE